MRRFASIVLLASAGAIWGFSQSADNAQNQTAQNQTSTETRHGKVKKSRSAGGDVGSGAGDIGKGAGKGAGHIAEGTAKGVGDTVTLHPVAGAEAVGTGAGKGAKDVGVGTAKGTGKVFKGIGKGIKHIF